MSALCQVLRPDTCSGLLLATMLALLVGCGTPAAVPESTAPRPAELASAAPAAATSGQPQANGEVLGRNARMAIYEAAEGDRFGGIAMRLLGDASLGWMVAEANGAAEPEAGRVLVVPLQPRNALGVGADQYQTVPILCYHRFGTPSSKMVMSPAGFAAQLEWLARNRWTVLRLADLSGFLEGKKALPPRSVVITIDDGYESVYRHAFPLLKKYGFAATLFVYTDFIGAGEALSFAQMQEMQHSGLVDIQSHSKSHRNLIERGAQENDARYKQSIELEMRLPRELLSRRLDGHELRHIAYPYGDANALVLDAAARAGFELGTTVTPGGNAFFAQALMLRRTMIFGDMDLEAFKARLQISRSFAAP